MITELRATKVLTVEDNESWQARYAEMLGPDGEGFQVVQANDFETAIAKLDAHQFALVIVDLKLPRSSHDPEPKFEYGLAVVDYVSNLESKPRILVVTGYQQLPLDDGRKLGQFGVDVAAKSDGVEDLLAKIWQLLPVHPTDIVMKFGGSSMGSAESISMVADIIAGHMRETLVPCTVVVSAMSKVTDTLLACVVEAQEGELESVQMRLEEQRNRHAAVADILVTRSDLRQGFFSCLDEAFEALRLVYRGVAALEEASPRTLDRISGYGERLSARLLAATLESRGIKSFAVDATELIVTDEVFGSATPLPAETEKQTTATLVPILESKAVPVVTGFIASTKTGIPTTLGRGGSDYSATILGAALDAREVWIWTDVTGVMNADPNLVPDAATITQMSYEQAAELTYHGAKVLHAKALAPVMGKHIPIRILNTFAPDEPGTLIGPSEDKSYAGGKLISSSGLGQVTVSTGLDLAWFPTIGAKALAALVRADMEIMSYSQSFSHRTLSITLRETDAARAASLLSREFEEDIARGRVQGISTRGQLAAVSIVGQQEPSPSMVGNILTSLENAGIKVVGITQQPTEKSCSILVSASALKGAVLAAHAAIASADQNKL